MKLKKIASLMLAGIMAVSMLAGCKSGSTNNGNAGSSSSQPTTTGVVAAVESGIKSWNSDLEIDVKSSGTFNDAIDALFAKNFDGRINDGVIVRTMNWVFDVKTGDLQNANDWNLLSDGNKIAIDTNVKDGTERYRFAIIPVTKADGDVNVYAGNKLGEAMKDLKNIVDTKAAGVSYEYMDVDYTMYVTDEATTMADGSEVNYVIVYMVASYSAHIA